jgi:hypothetical protein
MYAEAVLQNGMAEGLYHTTHRYSLHCPPLRRLCHGQRLLKYTAFLLYRAKVC